MEDPRIISALFIFLKMAYYNVLINTLRMVLSSYNPIISFTIRSDAFTAPTSTSRLNTNSPT